MRPFWKPDVTADPAWLHWAATVPLLLADAAGVPWALEAAMALCAAMAAYYFSRIRKLKPFPVQVRVAYFGWLILGMLPGMLWTRYIALAGTTLMVAVGYCPLERMLMMLWFNRSVRLTWSEAKRVALAPPRGGLFYRGPPAESAPAFPSCSLSR